MGASNDKQTMSGAQQQHSAAFRAARRPKQSSAATAPAAAGPLSPQTSVPAHAQGSSGKRVRKATAKALALEEELSQQGRSKRSKAAWQAQQQQDDWEDDDDGAFTEGMTEVRAASQGVPNCDRVPDTLVHLSAAWCTAD